MRKFLGISVSGLIMQHRTSWVYLPVIVHTKWGFEKWNESSPQWRILALLGNLGGIWKCKGSSVTEQGCSCLMSYLFISLLQNTAIQAVFGLHCTSNINSCTIALLLIVPLSIASILLLTLFAWHLLLTLGRGKEKSLAFRCVKQGNRRWSTISHTVRNYWLY